MEVKTLQHQILATMASRVTALGKRKLGFLGLFGPSIESVDHSTLIVILSELGVNRC